MKKRLIVVLSAILFATSLPAFAVDVNAATPAFAAQQRRVKRKRSFYKRHRDKINVGLGAGAGAVTGGKKGAGIGTLVGGGGAALYTYKLRKKNRKHRR